MSVPAKTIFLYGMHSVRAALQNPHRLCHRLIIHDATPHALLDELTPLAHAKKCTLTQKSRHDIDRFLPPMSVHQGLVLECAPLKSYDLKEFFAHYPQAQRLVLLDKITDPHNLGAIIRSAAVFEMDGIVTLKREGAPQSGLCAKAASGALEIMPLITVSNLGNTIRALKKKDFYCLGLDEHAATMLHQFTPPPQYAILLGAEGKGLRHKSKNMCDSLHRLQQHQDNFGLNVSNAAAIAFYQLQKYTNASPSQYGV